MSRYRKFTTMCCAAVFALGLAACGGGGNSGPNTSQEQMLQEQVATLQGQINTLRAQLGLAADDNLGDSIESLQMEVARLQKEIQDAKDETDAAARKTMAATAAKLYAGIAAQTAGVSATVAAGTLLAADQRGAAYNDAGVGGGAVIDTRIVVGIDDDAIVGLSEDKKTTVAANHGWAGKRYADAPGGDMVEALVYSNVEAPKPGKKFGSAEPGTGSTRPYEYLLAAGVLTNANAGGVGGTAGFAAARVAFTNVTRTAGTETFKLPSPNTNGATKITIPGSYHGVSGTYSCTPASGTTTCTAAVAAKGFTLSTADTWEFTPGNAEAQVMSGADNDYASYGWWIHKTENGKTFTASAFVDFKGTPGTVEIADLVGGTATYMGGAAGKYALASSTGGTNDAGHFTARATLEADFEDDTITGTIDNFMGADGMARDWSVELKKAALDNTNGAIARTADDDTVWTIGGTAGAASGEWSGNLREEGTDGVPKAATGTFYTEYGRAGRMVGAFGANKQ